MSIMMIRYEVPDEGATEVTGAVEAAFAALQAEQPQGVRFTYHRRAGSNEFIALLELRDGVDNPLLGIAAARELQGAMGKWAAGDPPKPRPLNLIGSYDSLH